jgi:hypothetical protein
MSASERLAASRALLVEVCGLIHRKGAGANWDDLDARIHEELRLQDADGKAFKPAPRPRKPKAAKKSAAKKGK